MGKFILKELKEVTDGQLARTRKRVEFLQEDFEDFRIKFTNFRKSVHSFGFSFGSYIFLFCFVVIMGYVILSCIDQNYPYMFGLNCEYMDNKYIGPYLDGTLPYIHGIGDPIEQKLIYALGKLDLHENPNPGPAIPDGLAEAGFEAWEGPTGDKTRTIRIDRREEIIARELFDEQQYRENKIKRIEMQRQAMRDEAISRSKGAPFLEDVNRDRHFSEEELAKLRKLSKNNVAPLTKVELLERDVRLLKEEIERNRPTDLSKFALYNGSLIPPGTVKQPLFRPTDILESQGFEKISITRQPLHNGYMPVKSYLRPLPTAIGNWIQIPCDYTIIRGQTNREFCFNDFYYAEVNFYDWASSDSFGPSERTWEVDTFVLLNEDGTVEKILAELPESEFYYGQKLLIDDFIPYARQRALWKIRQKIELDDLREFNRIKRKLKALRRLKLKYKQSVQGGGLRGLFGGCCGTAETLVL